MITTLRPSPVATMGDELDLDELAHDIARCGITCFELAVAAVADVAQRSGACPLLVAVLADTSAPRVVRERAYGLIAEFLAGRPVDRPAPELLCA